MSSVGSVSEFLKVLCACCYYYDESFTDMDVIIPYDTGSADAKDFAKWLVEAGIDDVHPDFESLDTVTDLFEFLDTDDEADIYQMCCVVDRYGRERNKKFMQDSMSKGKEYLSSNGYSVEEGYAMFMADFVDEEDEDDEDYDPDDDLEYEDDEEDDEDCDYTEDDEDENYPELEDEEDLTSDDEDDDDDCEGCEEEDLEDDE